MDLLRLQYISTVSGKSDNLLQFGFNILLVNPRSPWSIVPVKFPPSAATDIVCEVAAGTQTDQMCIVRWWADRDGFGGSPLKIA